MPQSRFKIWLDATRPKTLAAAFAPVAIGVALAVQDRVFDLIPSLFALVCAFLIQIGTNFGNDYYDFKKGADTDKRVGFVRATAKGLIAPETMFRATMLTMGLAFILGLYLVWHGGWIVLGIGVASLICGVAYTGGPFPLGYNGLGDVFVFLFFGLIAVMTTYYINALEWSMLSFWAAIPAGALSTNILVVNNLRDVETDRDAGKRTLGVLFGENALRLEYTFMVLLALAIPPHFHVQEGFSIWIYLPFVSVPLAIPLLKAVWFEKEKAKLNPVLEATARFMAVYCVLFSIAIVMG